MIKTQKPNLKQVATVSYISNFLGAGFQIGEEWPTYYMGKPIEI